MSGGLSLDAALELLGATAQALRAAPDEAGLALARMAEELVPALADWAVVYALAADGRLHPRSAVQLEDAEVRVAVPPGDRPTIGLDELHPAAAATREGGIAWIPHGGGSPLVARDGEVPATAPDAPVRSVALPLNRDGETVGALTLGCREGRGFRAEDFPVLVQLAHQISIGLENLRLRREVEAARRAKADFLAVMSHELRTPLTAVVGYADLIEAGISGPVTDRQATQLARIKESAWQLLELIDGILGYARYEGEAPVLVITEVHPEKLVEDALTLVRAGLREKGLDLDVTMQPDLPALRTDREKATKILFHLLSNARKFTEEGEVRVQVSADRDWVGFAVRDTGPGIEPGDLEQIFEPFWQGEQAETRTKGGTGMGLSLARRLAELLSAEIDVRSRTGDGSTFTLRLPRHGPHPSFP